MARAPGTPKPKISNVTAGFMLFVAILLDGIQFLFTIFVITSPLSILITILALCIFGVWFGVLGINYFSGRKSGLKVLSAFGSVFIEMVPLIDGLPAITAGVLGIIVSSRIEDRKKKAGTATGAMKFGPEKLPSAANDNEPVVRPMPQAANDNDEEEYSEAA